MQRDVHMQGTKAQAGVSTGSSDSRLQQHCSTRLDFKWITLSHAKVAP